MYKQLIKGNLSITSVMVRVGKICETIIVRLRLEIVFPIIICQILLKVIGKQSYMVLHVMREGLVAIRSLLIAGASFNIDRILMK